MELIDIGVSSVYIFINKIYDCTEFSTPFKIPHKKIGDEKIWLTQRQLDSLEKDEYIFDDITHFIVDGFGVWHGLH